MTFSVTDTAPADIDAATHTRPLHDAHAFPGAALARRPADVTRAGGRRCAAASTRRQRRQSRSAARPATGIPVVELRHRNRNEPDADGLLPGPDGDAAATGPIRGDRQRCAADAVVVEIGRAHV